MILRKMEKLPSNFKDCIINWQHFVSVAVANRCFKSDLYQTHI